MFSGHLFPFPRSNGLGLLRIRSCIPEIWEEYLTYIMTYLKAPQSKSQLIEMGLMNVYYSMLENVITSALNEVIDNG